VSSGNPRTAGFTILELLVASAVALVAFGILINIFSSTAQIQARSQVQLSVDESMRAATELIGMDLREATGTRVLDAAGAQALGLNTFISGSETLSLIRTSSGGSFYVTQPGGYPNSKSLGNSANTPINTPNSQGKQCKDIFSGSEYFMVTSSNDPYVYLMQAHDTNPCPSGDKVLHPKTKLQKPNGEDFQWSPTAQLTQISVLRYYIAEADGVSALMRQKAGDPAQVVAYDITGLKVEYSPDGASFGALPASPKAVRITLTGERERGNKSSALTLSTTVYMRDLVIPSKVAGS
jgi:type II secretory pathway pseudopilin PulG